MKLLENTCNAGPWMTSGNLRFREGAHHSLTAKTGLHYLNCLYNVVYPEHLLSFWKSGILAYARQRVHTGRASIKNPGHLFWWAFLVATFRICCHIHCWGNLLCPMELPWERILGNLCLISSGLFPLLILLHSLSPQWILAHEYDSTEVCDSSQ